jgi:hypothetical protein
VVDELLLEPWRPSRAKYDTGTDDDKHVTESLVRRGGHVTPRDSLFDHSCTVS